MADIKETLTRFASSVSVTSGEIIKTTKLTMKLNSEEEKLKQIYLEIGKKVHEIYSYGGNLGKAFDEKYEEILQQEEIINQLKEDMNRIKGMKNCPKCGEYIEKGIEFCSKCGYKLGEDIKEKTPIEEPIEKENTDEMLKVRSEDLHAEAKVELKKDIRPMDEPLSEKKKTKICLVCGKENLGEDKFCLYCGRMLIG